ncbi:leukemia inhibitory factor receptor-like [Platichthys flesus]|uniref:leukemia inhibitory factor receptor-like n=1 Tax=Platichthys flesus TaxID=8260 RepID=UPI002DBC0C24|nr:leukemia inhibitory factor receptor-like [Platichthys flesus]XP_062269077.1 leukemia inhibitory factor receptor-like [Platichthys flesus]
MKSESVTRSIMIPFILLSLFCHSSQDGNTGEHVVLLCGPKNLTLKSWDQTIQATWEDDPSCSAVKEELVYELLVLVRDQQVHHDLVTVTPEQIGLSHLWTWTSHRALECDSPSVLLSVRYRNYTSPRRQEGTLPGMTNSSDPEVYPRDPVFQVGSRATFCCVLPAGGTFTDMYLVGYNRSEGNITKINNQTYSLSLVLNQPSSPSGTDVKCEATIHQQPTDNGVTAFIGYPPDDRELQCETRDLESVECQWTVGRDTHLPTQYQLVGSAYECFQRTCRGKEDVSTGERSWKLRAHNELGTVELTDSADLMTRVHMLAPESVTGSTVNHRDARLKWSWKVQGYKDLNLTCEVNLSHAGPQKPNSGVGLDSTVLMNLIPNWSYNVTVRCRTTQHPWKWSSWSSTFNFHTKGDVPDALDVWMKMKDNEILIIWKILLEKQSHGHVLDYTVTWSNIRGTEQHNTTTVTHNHVTLRLDTTQQYVVNVTARNVNGSSSPSTIITPSSSSAGLNPTGVRGSRMAGGGGGFNVSWSSSPAASCGYIVDWCPSSSPSTVTWIKVPQTNVFLKNLREGQRYSVSISACTRGAALLLETREGYVQEQRIQGDLFRALRSKQTGSEVELSWDQIPLTEQTAFIQGYVLEWSDRDQQDNNTAVHNVSTDEPTSTSLTASDLKTSSYTFTVKARTALGECCSKQLIVHVNSGTDNWIRTVVISLAAVFSVLTLVSVVCCRQWACIKQKVYPPIPRPLLTDTWLRSTGERSLHVDQGPSEVDIMDAPQLLRKPGAQVNQPPPNLPPPLRSLPAPAGLPSSPFRGAFQNLSYDLMMQTEDQQPPEGHTAEYPAPTPPLDTAQEEPGSHMTCDLTYILVPQPVLCKFTPLMN